MPKKYAERTGAFCAGLAAALLGLEILLRAIGFTYLKINETSRPAAGPGSAILCVGASFTHGLGASKGGDYPSQLEKLLNADGPGGPYAVINRGVPASNMAMTLQRLPALLDELKPGIVLLSVSSSIYWNYWGYAAYRGGGAASNGLNKSLYRLRIWKLAILIRREITKKRQSPPAPGKEAGSGPGGWQLRRMQRPEKAAEWFKRELSEKPDTAHSLVGLGMSCLDMKLYAEARGHFEKAISLGGSPGMAYYGMGLLHDRMGEPGKAEAWFKRGLAAAPAFGGNYCGLGELSMDRQDHSGAMGWSRKGIAAAPGFALNYFTLGRAYRAQGRSEEAFRTFEAGIRAGPSVRQNYMGMQMTASKESGGTPEAGLPEHEGYGELLREFSGAHRAAADYLAMAGAERNMNEEIRDWVAADLETAVELCRARHIRIMFVSNPSWNIGVLAETAKRLSVPFVDNFRLFTSMWEQGENKADYRASDGWHCNDRGYRVMAENVHRQLTASGLLKK